jgi:hypothetical protein
LTCHESILRVDGLGEFNPSNPSNPSNPLISSLINMLETLDQISKTNKGIGRNGLIGLIETLNLRYLLSCYTMEKPWLLEINRYLTD